MSESEKTDQGRGSPPLHGRRRGARRRRRRSSRRPTPRRSPAAAPPPSRPRPPSRAPATSPAFLRLLDMLAQTAALYMEGFPDPATGRRQVDLAGARQIVDSLLALREKTRGRLSFEETDALEGLLGELQLVFTRLAAAAKAEAARSRLPRRGAAEVLRDLSVGRAPHGRARAWPPRLFSSCSRSLPARFRARAGPRRARASPTETAFRKLGPRPVVRAGSPRRRRGTRSLARAQGRRDPQARPEDRDPADDGPRALGDAPRAPAARSREARDRARGVHGRDPARSRTSPSRAGRACRSRPRRGRWARSRPGPLRARSARRSPTASRGASCSCASSSIFLLTACARRARRHSRAPRPARAAARPRPQGDRPDGVPPRARDRRRRRRRPSSLPLLLSLDVLWLALFLFVLLFGYASLDAEDRDRRRARPRRSCSCRRSTGSPTTSRITSSPILRAAEALAGVALRPARPRQSRGGQEHRAGRRGHPLPSRPPLPGARAERPRDRRVHRRARSVAPRDIRCLVNRGNIRFVDGDLGSAQEDYQEALKRDAAQHRGALQPRAPLRRDVPDGRGRPDARRRRGPSTRARSRASRTTPTLVKVVSLGFTPEEARGEDRAHGARQPQPAPPRPLPATARRRLGLARFGRLPLARLGVPLFAVCVGARFSLDRVAQAGARLRVRVPEVRPDLLPALQAAGRERAPVLAVRPRVSQEGRRRDRDEAPEARGRAGGARRSRSGCGVGPEPSCSRARPRSSTRASSSAVIAFGLFAFGLLAVLLAGRARDAAAPDAPAAALPALVFWAARRARPAGSSGSSRRRGRPDDGARRHPPRLLAGGHPPAHLAAAQDRAS